MRVKRARVHDMENFNRQGNLARTAISKRRPFYANFFFLKNIKNKYIVKICFFPGFFSYKSCSNLLMRWYNHRVNGNNDHGFINEWMFSPKLFRQAWRTVVASQQCCWNNEEQTSIFMMPKIFILKQRTFYGIYKRYSSVTHLHFKSNNFILVAISFLTFGFWKARVRTLTRAPTVVTVGASTLTS